MVKALKLFKLKEIHWRLSLITSSESSYAKTNFESEVAEKEEGDLDGPLDIAVAITDKWYENNEEYVTKLVVIGNTQFY